MAQPRLKMRLGDLLVQERIISDDQLQLALQQQRPPAASWAPTLIDLSFIGGATADLPRPSAGCALLRSQNLTIDASAVTLLPEVRARRFTGRWRSTSATTRSPVVMSDPADLSALDAIAALLSPRELVLAVARKASCWSISTASIAAPGR